MRWASPASERIQVGVTSISEMQTCAGMVATNSAMAAMSSGFSRRFSSSSGTGTGRLRRIGVSTSPGQMQVERMLWMPFSWLMACDSATKPCFAAV